MNPFIEHNNIKFSQKITLLVCAFLLCLIMTTMLNTIIMAFTGSDSMVFINLSILTQNLFAFILPVIITIVFISPKPISFLQIDKVPSWKTLTFLFVTFFTMAPAMNYLVEWNNNISLPDSMKGIETWMRNTEDAAQAVTDRILNKNNIILSILLVGLLTGLSEEFLFRGGLQRILATKPINIHIAIWITAFIFSAIHFQFFGFFPRLILGAFFGYMAYWSGSLWTAIIAHALNNSTVIIAHALNNMYGFNFDNLGVTKNEEFPILALLSTIVTIVLIYKFPKINKTSL